MTQNLNYLSDEELELLIVNVEQNELVMAPPDMFERILERIDAIDADAENNSKKPKPGVEQPVKAITNIREFRRYCFRICASVAAAVVLVFAMPAVSDNLEAYVPEREKFSMESRYATKEEALNDQSYLMQKFGGTNIFSGERELGIFTGRNGGS